MNRDEIQQLAVEKYLSGNKKTLFNLSVRLGKTRVGIMIMQKLEAKKVLILYPNVKIKESWENEFLKMNWVPNIIHYSTYRSMEHADDVYDIIIGDEVQLMSISNLISLDRMLDDNKRFLGLSGTYSSDTKQDLLDYCGLSISYEYTTEEAVKDGIVNDYNVIIKQFDLSGTLGEWKKKKDGSKYFQTEKTKSKQLTNALEYAKIRGAEAVKFAAFNRMRWVNRCPSLRHNIVLLLSQLKDKKVLLFGGETSFIDDVGIKTHHSKNESLNNLQKFIDGEINQLGLVNIGSTGITFNNLDTIIITNINSNCENLFQKLARSLLKEEGKHSTIYILCSTEDYQQKWLKKGISEIPKEKISYE